ncbi:MAG: hypothetical protein KA713_01260 [Chryseotalea sp. WA131a]|nr:MAG: hypothetical protein KA713_01260 [Chryseotalea sp. WA131a]
MEILIIINILTSLIGSSWLIYMVRHQRQIIKDQSEKLNELEKYTTLFKQLTQIIEPNNVLKLLETKKKLMEQENEAFRRRLILDTNNKLGKEWGAVLERQIIPKYNDIIKEYGDFILFYLQNADFKSEDEKNGFIRMTFPKSSDLLLDFLGQGKNPAQTE